MLTQSWNFNVGSYVLTVVSSGERGDLVDMAKIITKYTSIASCITLDVQQGELVRRTLFTLPSDVSHEKLERIVASLERKNFKVPEIEDLQS